MRRGLALLGAVAIACGSAGEDRSARTPGGAWIVNTDPQPPAVGARAGLFFEYVPTPGGRADPFAGTPPRIVATCASCGAAPIEAATQPYPTTPEDLYEPTAIAAYTAAIVLPRAGTWSIAPFGVTVTVRALDDFEPPLIHVNRWSDPFDPGCGRREVATLVKDFAHAYNAGDTARLGELVQGPWFSFSLGDFRVMDRTAFLDGALQRHRNGERLTFERVQVSSNHGAPQMGIYGSRTANDLPPGGQRFGGKAAMWCSQRMFIHLNLGVI